MTKIKYKNVDTFTNNVVASKNHIKLMYIENSPYSKIKKAKPLKNKYVL